MNKLEADVVIVAAGAAGLAAAVSAAQGGAKVIVFEKGSTTRGTGNMGIPGEARPENIHALTDTVREYGVY